MSLETKGKSPFYPGQPVPVELFVGRRHQIDRLEERAIGQVKAGKPVAVFVQGEYGIGKSSIAQYLQWVAEREYGLHSIYATLGGVKNLQEVAENILTATVRSGVFNPSRSEAIRNWMAKYIGKQELFGLSLNLEALRADAPRLSQASDLLDFLAQVQVRLAEDKVRGIFLVLDEINGIASNPEFAHFLKGLIEANSRRKPPLPLLLMLCGVEERRRDLIRCHQPIDRIFDVVEIERMKAEEMRSFFINAFESVRVKVHDDALAKLCEYSAGFPKIMHEVGDQAFWINQDEVIDIAESTDAVYAAASEVGRKYVDQQIYKALQSKDYKNFLNKIAGFGPDEMTFTKGQIEKNLNTDQKKKLNNFLQKMKKLNVIKSGDASGEYEFNVRMVRLYIWMRSISEIMPSP
ncbi:MAG: ATP-binding protein [Verrucomicrobiae bacterium]|nr:ATP-binding protein [Verrucomicrobiae bacterium]